MIEITVPRESVNDESVIVQRVLLPDGAFAELNQAVVELDTSKTMIEVAAPAAGTVRHCLVAGTEMPVGAVLFTMGDPAANQTVSTSVASATTAASSGTDGIPPLLSRAALLAAARVGTDLAAFQGRWVTESEILSGRINDGPNPGLRREITPGTPQAGTRAVSLPVIPFQKITQGKRKRSEVDSLLKGQHAATTSTIGIRIQLPGDRLVAADFLFTDNIADLLLFEASRLLRQFPELNGFNIDTDTMGQYGPVNFGLSFDNDRNLKVLSLRDADLLGLPEIQRQYVELLELYESNRPLPIELLTTATVTLSDLSLSSASFMLPLINGQQALILGVVRHNRRLFEVLASFDHRVAEGLRVTRFLEQLRDRVESHFRDGDGVAHLKCDSCGRSMLDELRLGGRGFVNMTLANGDAGHLCRNCFEGR